MAQGAGVAGVGATGGPRARVVGPCALRACAQGCRHGRRTEHLHRPMCHAFSRLRASCVPGALQCPHCQLSTPCWTSASSLQVGSWQAALLGPQVPQNSKEALDPNRLVWSWMHVLQG